MTLIKNNEFYEGKNDKSSALFIYLFICRAGGGLELIPASWATGRGHSEWMDSPSQGSYTHANSTQKGLLAVGL